MSDHYETNFVKKQVNEDDKRVQLKNGRFLDVINGKYFNPEVSLIIENGRIRAMPGLPGESTDIRPDFIIDLKGKTVLPGLFNTHCHVNMTLATITPGLQDIRLSEGSSERQKAKNMAECLAHGITNVRDAYTEDLRATRTLRKEISKGEIPGPRIMQSVVVGPPGSYLIQKYGLAKQYIASALGLTKAFGIAKMDHSRMEAGVVEFPIDATEKQVREAVDIAIDERGAEAIKIGEQRENVITLKHDSTIMTINQLEALADQTRLRGLKSMMHHRSVESFRRGVKAGVSSLSHYPIDALLTKEDSDTFKAAGCIIEPTISTSYGLFWKIKGDPWYDHPEMNRLTEFRDKTYTYIALADEYYIPELRDRVITSYEKLSKGRFRVMVFHNLSPLLRHYARGIYYGLDNLRLLFEHDAHIALANDGGAPPLTPAMMRLELTLLDFVLNKEPANVKLSSAEAARISTINSAYSMGLEKDFGSIETGKVADLVILDGDPLEEPCILGSRVDALFMDGRLVIDNCGLEVKAIRAA